MFIEIKTVPNTYRPSCPRRVYVLKCDSCTKTFERKFIAGWLERHKWGQFCSRKCLAHFKSEHPELYAANTEAMHTPEVAAKISASLKERAQQPGYVHSQTGLKRSESTRALLRQRKAENSLVGEKNGMWGRRHKESSKESMSDKHSMMLITGQKRPYGGNSKKGDYVSSKTGRSHYFKSGWEEAVMKHLDSCDVVTTWNYECVRIPYYYDNHKRWYVPDFIVTFWGGESDMWEVKPKEFINSQKNILKEAAAREWCKQNDVSTYRVLTGDDLRAMQVIA